MRLIEPNSLLCRVVCPEGRENLPEAQGTILVPFEADVLCRKDLLCDLKQTIYMPTNQHSLVKSQSMLLPFRYLFNIAP